MVNTGPLDGRLGPTAWYCTRCGTWHPFPRRRCDCGAGGLIDRPLSAAGTVHAATTWARRDGTNLVLVLVDAVESTAVRFLATAEGEPAIGTPVHRVDAVTPETEGLPVVAPSRAQP